jgi:hypothetical protein
LESGSIELLQLAVDGSLSPLYTLPAAFSNAASVTKMAFRPLQASHDEAFLEVRAKTWFALRVLMGGYGTGCNRKLGPPRQDCRVEGVQSSSCRLVVSVSNSLLVTAKPQDGFLIDFDKLSTL